jgi:hypothetical protein
MNETQAMWLVTIAVMVINFVFYRFRIGSDSTLGIVSYLLPVVCGLFAAGSLFRVTFYLKTWDLTKTAWMLLAIGFLFWWLGECTYAVLYLSMNAEPCVP